ncbi:MAG: DinB family protein [Anaerolineales bacterium]|nr:DinB family protein [Anaerolineales bacterium]
MHDPEVLANVFSRNQWVIGEQTKGLTHADSLLQPEPRGNCLNFILGHMLVHREKVMEMLDLKPLLTKEQFQRYDFGADPVLEDGPKLIQLDELLAMLEKSAAMLVEAVKALAPDDLERDVKLGSNTATLAQRIEFFGWHDTYHAGQTEYLRQLAGTDDKVV